MSEWLEGCLKRTPTKTWNKSWNIKKEIQKPCHACGFCPYGQLVEAFPIHTESLKYAEEHGLYSKFVDGKGWVSCNKDDVGASLDLNSAIGKVEEPFSCKAFGHNCPVFYCAEPIVEDK